MFVHKQGSLSTHDLDDEVRELIADVYPQDFETFGYEDENSKFRSLSLSLTQTR